MTDICWHLNCNGNGINTIHIMFTLYKYCGVRFQFQKINSILAKLLLLNKASESIQPTLANPIDDFSTIIFQMLDLKLI